MSLTDLSKENLQTKEKPDRQSLTRLALQSISNSSINQEKPKQASSDYSSEILSQLLLEELDFKVPSAYLTSQSDITSKMRSILIDWLVSVHQRFKLLPETLFLTVKIIDRYLFSQESTRKELQLVGIASLFIASKYEEIYPPELRDLVLLTDRAYTNDQVISMERKILKILNFKITMPSSWRFFEKYSEDLTEEAKAMGQYLLELSLLEESMLQFTESLLAVSAIFISQKFFKKDWIYSLVTHTEQEIRPCATEMLILFQLSITHPLTSIRDKFSKPQFYQVSTICLE